MDTHHAYCSCRKLSVKAHGEPYVVVACWCQACRRRTGSALGVGAYYQADVLNIEGESRRYTRPAPEGRQFHNFFCPACGTTLYWKTDLHPDGIAIALGSFDDPGFLRPQRGVWSQHRPSWLNLDDDIPCHVHGSQSPVI